MCSSTTVISRGPQMASNTIMRTVLRPDDDVICPRLPPEVWDRIIDFVGGAQGPNGTGGWRRDVHACSLVCHAFLPRSLLHLYEELELRSATHLTHVVHVLSNSPILRNRVRVLIINAKDGVNQSWVSLVPIRLRIRTLPYCRYLVLRGVDLSTMHSHAKTAFSCLRQQLWHVVLEDVHYFSPMQLARFFHIAETVSLRYSPHDAVKGREVTGLRCLPPCPMGRDQFQGEQRYFILQMSWATLAQVTRNWDLTMCNGEWHISLRIFGDFEDTTDSATALENVVKVLGRLQPFGKSNITMYIVPAEVLPFDIRLHQGE